MLRYVATAQALRAFSISPATRSLYRRIGNRIGGKGRSKGIPPHYIPRAEENLALIESVDAIRDGMSVMELGTGWVHWEALFTRLFYDVQITLFDVWDNRQFEGFKRYLTELRSEISKGSLRPHSDLARAEALASDVLACRDFEEAYAILGFRYVVSEDGALDAIGDRSLDLVVSSDVLEHVQRDAVPDLLRAMYRKLKPGAHAAHRITPFDHLKIYDKSVHDKNYLRFNDRTWKMFFENDVQYQNRIQHSEWLRLFESAGFSIILEKSTLGQELGDLPVSARFASCDVRDLRGINTHIIARVPE